MNTQQLFFYTVVAVCAVVFVRLVNQVVRMDVEEKTKAWLYIDLFGCLVSSYVTSCALNGFNDGGHIPMAARGLLLLATLSIYALLIRRHMQQIINKTSTPEIKLGETNIK